jgi:uncharacterized protein involved in exopolysaccharide biosynthesis
MTKKYAEVQVTVDDTSSNMKIASYSIPSLQPESRNVLRNSAIIAVLGFFFGIILVLLKDWWETNTASVNEPSYNELSS